jgi:hypothetical protein
MSSPSDRRRGCTVVRMRHRRLPRCRWYGAGDLPSAQKGLEQRVLRLPERQIVDVREAQHVTTIVARRPPIALFVVGVEQDVTLVAGVVARLAERVGHAELEAVAVAAVRADLQRVINGAPRIFRQSNCPVAFVRSECGDVHARIRIQHSGG